MTLWHSSILQHELLQTHYSEHEAMAIQQKWAEIRTKSINSSSIQAESIHWVAGVDISFPKVRDPTWGIACATLWDVQKQKLVTSVFSKGDLPFPYIPGLLGFRESRLEIEALMKLPQKPDVILCDGHGLIHPRSCGEAVHLGLISNIPSVGVAKKMFIGNCDLTGFIRKRGNKRAITEDGTLLGYAICLLDNCMPVYISIGHRISLDQAIEVALATAKSNKQPEPVFQADQISRDLIHKLEMGKIML